MNNNNCGCPTTVCTPTHCGCPVYISSDCVNNIKSVFSCSQIDSNLDLTQTLELFDQYVCDRFNTIQNYFTLVNVGSGVGVYKGINLLGQKELKSLFSVNDLLVITGNTSEIDFEVDTIALTAFIEDLIPAGANFNAANVGGGIPIYKNEVASTFNFRTLTSTDSSVVITQPTADTVNLSVPSSNTIVEAGDNVTVDGTGTSLDPYVINAEALSLESGVTTNVYGDGSLATPYTVETINLQKTINTFPYTILAGDDKHTIFVDNSASNVVINIPLGLPSNFAVAFIQRGSASVQIVENVALNLHFPATLGDKIKGQYYDCLLERDGATNNYYLLGQIKA